MRLLKMSAKKTVSILLVLALLVSMFAISTLSALSANAAEGETMNRSDITIYAGDKTYSTNKAYLEVESGNAVLLWASGNDKVATVSVDGTVTAVGVGETTITAKTAQGTAACKVTVKAMPGEISFPEKPVDSKPPTSTYPQNDSVHDPEIIYVESEDMYYMLCTHNRTIRKSSDLVNWTNTVTLSSGFSNTADNFVKEYGKYTSVGFWAPDFVWNPVMQKYLVYYSVSNTLSDGGRGFGNKCSAIGMTYLDPVAGQDYSLGSLDNWKDGGIVVKSYDAWRDGGYIRSTSGEYRFGMDNLASANFGPNAIDPMVTFDDSGERMFMVYGSFFSGIYVIELDPQTGLPFDQASLNPSDPNYEVRYNAGVCVANRGGTYAFAEPLDDLRRQEGASARTQAGIEGPTMFYNEDTGYYYLIASYDYLDSTYNMRVGRSKNIWGPYYDYNGLNMVTNAPENIDKLNQKTLFNNNYIDDPANPNFLTNTLLGANDGMLVKDEVLSYDPNVGTKIMNPYQFSGGQRWVATGHNSTFKDKDGNWKFGMHAKTPQRLHVRNVLWTDDGWPMASPARYAGEELNQPIDASRMVGSFELAVFPRVVATTSYQYVGVGVAVQLKADGTVTSSNANYTGTWRMSEANKIEITVGGVSYYGEVQVGWDWENWDDAEFVFAGLSDDGTMLWGKGGTTNAYEPITLADKDYNEYVVKAGQTFEVPFIIKGAENLGGVTATITYDPSLFSLVNVTAGNGFVLTQKNTSGKIELMALASPGKSGDVTFATAKFTVKNTVSQIVTSPILAISTEVIDSATNPLDLSITDSYVTIVSGLKGDINFDGTVNMADALMALQYTTGNRELNKYEIAIGDMDDSGDITLADVMAIMNLAMS